jgi:hypothetical protein
MRAATVLLSSALIVLPARAEWRVSGRAGGFVSAVAAQSDVVFVGVGARVHIFDITDPSVPRETGATLMFGDTVSDIVLSGSRAYIAAGTDGIHIVDVSDRTNPSTIGTWNSPGSAEGIAVDGSLMYVADGPFGLQIVDVSDPATPRPVASVFDTSFAFDVVVHHSHAFIAGADQGLMVADVSVRDTPREVAILNTPGYARDLAIDSSTLFLADQWGGVRVVSITDPRQPREMESLAIPGWAFAVAVSNGTLLVASGSQGLHIFDVTNPAAPRAAGAYPIPVKVTWKVATSGGRALVGTRTEGVHIVDVTQPAAARALGLIAPLADAVAVTTPGNFAYVLTRDQGVRVVDVTRSDKPRDLGGATLQGFGAVGGIELVADRFVYAGTGQGTIGQVEVFDVSGAAITRVGLLRLPSAPIELVRHGSFLYVPDEFGLQILDVSNPAAPVLKGRSVFPPELSGCMNVAVNGPHAFASGGPSGLKVVDVSDPPNMKIVGNLPFPEGIGPVAYRDGFVYGTTGLPSPRLLVVDVRDPRSPKRVSETPLPGVFSGDVLLDGRYAFVANGGAGVAVIDVSDAARPAHFEQIATPGFALHLALSGGRILVTGAGGGLLVVERDPSNAIAENHVQSTGPSAPAQLPARTPPPPRAVSALAPSATRNVMVTSTADSGPGTLRDALSTLVTGDVITFDPAVFPPRSPATIRVTTVLPHVKVDAVTIDASNAGVILDGSSLSGAFESGIEIEEPSKGNVIRGMQIENFPASGIFLGGKGGNIIGGDRTRGAGPTGEGNRLSRNANAGVFVGDPNRNRIVGNLIGTDVTGRISLGRQSRGVSIFYPPDGRTNLGFDRVGGDEPWEANVIAGNVVDEVLLFHGGGHAVIANFIGTDVDGNAIGQASRGVNIDASSDNVVERNVIVARNGSWIIDQGACCNRVIGNWFGVKKSGQIIPTPFEGGAGGVAVNESFNLIASNVLGGIRFGAVAPSGQANLVTETIIAGNTFLGESPTRPMAGEAIPVNAASRTFIGGTTEPFRNRIHAGSTGIRLFGGVERTFILGNVIGDDDVTAMQNLDGIRLEATSVLTFIQSNIIANGSGSGIVVRGANHRIRRNSIYGNGGAGIAADGATAVPAAPVINAATQQTVSGTACAHCTVEIFSDGGSQGRWYEGTTTAAATGLFTFTAGGVLRGSNVTATATNASGSTSKFSAPFPRPPQDPRRRAVRH